MTILAIDPGNTESAYIVIDKDCRPLHFDKVTNTNLLAWLRPNGVFDYYAPDHIAIEMVASYGMPVGAEVFETCVWIGRFHEAITARIGREPTLVDRRPIKLHHCLNATASDSNIAQALKDRFAPGVRNHGKGTNKDPGWFHGFHTDIWQSYALAVYVADQLKAAV